jgi:hypothetical protein
MFRLTVIVFLSCIFAVYAIFPEDISREDNEALQKLEQRIELGVSASGDSMIWEHMDSHIDDITRKLNEWKAGDKASPDGITSFGIPGTTPLNGTCLNLNCDYFYYYLTCKEFGVNMDHICASYFVGESAVHLHVAEAR